MKDDTINGDRPEVFRGHLEECFRHFGASLATLAPKGSREILEFRQSVAEFCGVGIESVSRWFRTGSLPVGCEHIKLMCYLDLVGYRVIELERILKGQRNYAELIGFGLLTGEQASQLLGYSRTPKIYEVLRGSCNTSKAKKQKMWDEWKIRREELGRVREQARQHYGLATPGEIIQVTEKAKPPLTSSRQTAAVRIMEGLLDLLEEDLFDGSSEDGSSGLDHSAANIILRLSARLSTLSSRLIMSEQKKGGG